MEPHPQLKSSIEILPSALVEVGTMPAANEDSEDVYATVDWDAVVAQLKAMGPPPARPRFEGEADHPIFREPSMDPVFKPDVDLAAPTEEDQRWGGRRISFIRVMGSLKVQRIPFGAGFQVPSRCQGNPSC